MDANNRGLRRLRGVRAARAGDRRRVPDLDPRPREGYHDPTAGWGGAAPARSALTLRFVLAAFGFAVCVAGAVLFVTIVDAPVLSAILAFFAAVAVVDAGVVVRRKRRGEPG